MVRGFEKVKRLYRFLTGCNMLGAELSFVPYVYELYLESIGGKLVLRPLVLLSNRTY